MSAPGKTFHWQMIFMLALIPWISACLPNPAPIKGESPLKATSRPTEITAEPFVTQTHEPEATETPEECLEIDGQLIEGLYRLPNSARQVPMLVYLPPCYTDTGELQYPVAYFLHGYPQDQMHWIDLGVIETYERLLNADQIAPMLLVFPYQPEPYFTQSDGGPGSLEEVLLDHVFDAVNTTYQISPDPREHAILGVSRGGVWALEVGMRHPDIFNIVAALSPALAYNRPRRAYDPFEIARTADTLPAYLLISSGEREPQFSNEIDRFAGILTQSKIDFLYLRHEGRHEDSAWAGIMDQVLKFVGGAILESRTIVLE